MYFYGGQDCAGIKVLALKKKLSALAEAGRYFDGAELAKQALLKHLPPDEFANATLIRKTQTAWIYLIKAQQLLIVCGCYNHFFLREMGRCASRFDLASQNICPLVSKASF